LSFTVRELADLVQGTLQGDGAQVITEAHSLAHAGGGHITFLEHARDVRRLAASPASAFVVPPDVLLEGRTVIQTKDPLGAFIAIVRHLRGKETPPPEGVDARAVVHPSVTFGPGCSVQALATIGENTTLGARCRVYPGAVIGNNCKLGDDVVIHPNAVLYEGTVVGDRAIVHSGAVLGADGFGYRLHQGKHVKVPQLGHVVIGNDVEVGAGSAIDRGTFDATHIGNGTKIDNLVQIGHNCQIGPHNLIVSLVGIAGSCKTGSHVVIAGQAGLADHVHIGDQVIVGAQAGVSNDLAGGARYFGTPATPEREQKRMLAVMTKLPEMRQDLRLIKKHLGLTDQSPPAGGARPPRTGEGEAA
jgi:UDP-3-O-[3-hydroxymyristoyl] glucosamine N-acyltransferase